MTVALVMCTLPLVTLHCWCAEISLVIGSLGLVMQFDWLNMRQSPTIVIMSLHEIFGAGIWQTLTPVVRAVVLNQLSQDYS